MENTFALTTHPLSRDGLSQPDRRNEALRPDSAGIDDRNLGDLLQFLYEYARQVNYYRDDDQFREGDWAPFFQQSIPFQYATIGGFDLTIFERQFEEADRSIRRRLTFESLNALFDLIFDAAGQLEQWLISLEADSSGLKTAIESLIDTNLRARFLTAVGLANAAGKWGYKRRKNVALLTRYWGVQIADLYRVDATFLSLRGSLKYKVLEARGILEELFRTFFKGLEEIIGIANDEQQLEKSLQNADRQDHQPHLGLLFAFLLLFKELQGNLNSLSDAHLNFFYRKTLQLKEQPILPDKAHLVFELAKKVETDVLLEKGTRLKAGKDANNQDILFELEDEIVLTKTRVADLKTLFIEQGATGALLPGKLSAVYAAPVADSADGQGEAFAKDQAPTWKTVGAPLSKWVDPDTGQRAPHPFARLGFVLASKVLFLREGTRKIFLTIPLDKDCPPTAPITANFDVYLSTEEGWTLYPNVVNGRQTPMAVSIDPNASVFSLALTLPADFPPVVYPGAGLLEADYGFDLPMLKLELNQKAAGNQNSSDNPYYWLRALRVREVKIDVYVCDVRNLIVQNDQAVVDINKPFQPFGPLPKKNSSNFLIGSEEIFCKNWRAIDVNVRWKDKPGNFATYYDGYPNPPSQSSFKTTVDVLSEKNWITGSENNTPINPPLFSNYKGRIARAGQTSCPPGGGGVIYTHVDRTWFAGSKSCLVPADILNGYSTDLACGFLRFKLGGEDFRHEEYPQVLTNSMLQVTELPDLKTIINELETNNDSLRNSAIQADNRADNNEDINAIRQDTQQTRTLAISSESLSDQALTFINRITDNNGNLDLPASPYTPLIETLSLDYHASAATSDKDVFFTHLHPWQGTYERFAPERFTGASPGKPSLLPCFVDEGALYIGLADYRPGSLLHLLFQMEPASADPDVDKAVVCWEYLRHNTWKSLRPDQEVLADDTAGLIQSGIVRLAVPADMSNQETTIMPRGLHWLKARVLLRTAAISETRMIHTQAARGVFVPGAGSDLARLAAPLEAGKAAKFEAPRAAVKSVGQPYPSFGGRPVEATENFNRRISEHLRHKGRGVSLYDYENLVLQAFPDVYKVKCITHTLGRRGQMKDYELAPGFVTIVVVPDLEKVNAVDIFQPRVPAATLQAIKEFLKKRISPFIRLEVLNPIYEPVSVTAKIQFRKGKSVNFYLGQLEKEVQGFLAPWSAADSRQDISFGGQIYYSLILDFIEKRSYVDFVLELSLAGPEGELTDIVKATTSRSVLTTAPAHRLLLPSESDLLPEERIRTRRGIGFDRISK